MMQKVSYLQLKMLILCTIAKVPVTFLLRSALNNLEEKLIDFVKRTPYLWELLQRSDELNIPNWYFGAGCLSQSYWNFLTGRPAHENIKDIDWIYFDSSDLSDEREKKTQSIVQNHFKDLDFELDVNNQARVHLWYPETFGYSITPYSSSEDAIKTWPTTTTAVALSKRNGEIKVYAPFGLEDFFSSTIRANKTQITKKIYEGKCNRWIKHWPDLKIIPW